MIKHTIIELELASVTVVFSFSKLVDSICEVVSIVRWKLQLGNKNCWIAGLWFNKTRDWVWKPRLKLLFNNLEHFSNTDIDEKRYISTKNHLFLSRRWIWLVITEENCLFEGKNQEGRAQNSERQRNEWNIKMKWEKIMIAKSIQ